MIYKIIHWAGNCAGSVQDLDPQQAVDTCVDLMQAEPNAGILLIEIAGNADGTDKAIPIVGENSSALAKQAARGFLDTQIFPIFVRE